MKKQDNPKVEETPLNIYQKLFEIRKELEYIQKGSKGYGYMYASEFDILKDVRPLLDKYGLFLKFDMEQPTIGESTRKITTAKDGTGEDYSTYHVQSAFKFTWINVENPDQTLTSTLYLQEIPGDPKKIGGMMTYAMKYFLLKTFQVPTADKELETFQNEKGNLSVSQVKQLYAELRGFDQIKEKVLSTYQLERLEDLPVEEFSKCIKRIKSSKADVTGGSNGNGNTAKAG